MLKRVLTLSYLVASLVLMLSGYMFEEPFGTRRIVMVSLCALYMLLLSAKVFYRLGSLYTIVMSGLLVVMLLIIEIYSKYAINYFFHTFYLLLIFFAILYIETRYAVMLSVVITLLSFVKFIQLIQVAPTFANISLMVFFGSFQILIVVIGVFLRVYREESKKTKDLYRELLQTHDQLKAYSNEIKELSKVEARTVIARDLHDTLGHDLTGLIMQMEMASGCYDDGDEEGGRSFLESSKQSARESLVKVRAIVETLKNSSDDNMIENSIRDLIDSFSEKTGCTIQFSEKGKKVLKPSINLVLYRVVQESMTNALRHGMATLIYVSLIYKEEEVVFVIEDNGQGCDMPVAGNGLKGMRERLEEVGGSMNFAGRQSGFIVKGRIPL